MCCSELSHTYRLIPRFFISQNQESVLLVNPMEWYFGSDFEDLAVPKDEEIFDRFPSPDGWSSLGRPVGSFNSPKKLTELGIEELLFSENMFSSEVEQQCNPSVSQRSRCDYPDEHSDFELDDLSAIDEADDIFLLSLYEADANAMEVDRSAKFTQTSSKDDSVVVHLGERNYIKDCTNNVKNLSPSPPAKEPEIEMCVSEEHSDVCEYIIDEDISMEESVLMELQTLTVQLAKKTRICFRDSLYRLAENSRHQTNCSQNGKDLEQCKPTTSGVQSRLRESKAKKLERNAIDSTVATLLFNTGECCNLSASSNSGLTMDMLQGEYEGDSHFYQPVPGGDAEVPKFVTT